MSLVYDSFTHLYLSPLIQGPSWFPTFWPSYLLACPCSFWRRLLVSTLQLEVSECGNWPPCSKVKDPFTLSLRPLTMRFVKTVCFVRARLNNRHRQSRKLRMFCNHVAEGEDFYFSRNISVQFNIKAVLPLFQVWVWLLLFCPSG